MCQIFQIHDTGALNVLSLLQEISDNKLIVLIFSDHLITQGFKRLTMPPAPQSSSIL